FSASTSRSRGGALVCNSSSNRFATSETSDTARLNAAALAADGLLKPDSLRTNCSAEAWISSRVAGGSKLNSVLMLRHMDEVLAKSCTSQAYGALKTTIGGRIINPHERRFVQ